MSVFPAPANFLGAKLAWQLSILSGNLSDPAKVVGCLLMHDLHSERRCAWRSQSQMAEMLGKDVRNVRRAIAELVAKGYIEKTPGKGRSQTNQYRAIFGARYAATGTPLGSNEAPSFGTRAISPSVKREMGAKSSGNEGAVAPQYLQGSIHSPLPPQRTACVESARGSPCDGLGRAPSHLRKIVVASKGEGWAVSWLDPSRFDAKTGTLHPTTGVARDRIQQEAGELLREHGVELGDPRAMYGRAAA